MGPNPGPLDQHCAAQYAGTDAHNMCVCTWYVDHGGGYTPTRAGWCTPTTVTASAVCTCRYVCTKTVRVRAYALCVRAATQGRVSDAQFEHQSCFAPSRSGGRTNSPPQPALCRGGGWPQTESKERVTNGPADQEPIYTPREWESAGRRVSTT